MKKFLAFVLCAIMIVSLVGCGGTPATPGTSDTKEPAQSEPTEVKEATGAGTEAYDPGRSLKVGVHIPLTGTNAPEGQAGLNAIELYIDKLNERGGLYGYPVELVVYDDANTPETSVTVATKLIEVDKVDIAQNGIGSSCCLASGELFNAAGIPTFGLGISATFMQQGWEWMFRPTINSTTAVQNYPKYWAELGFKTVAILSGQDDYGINNTKAIVENAEAAGITIVANETVTAGDTDFSGQIANIISANPDVVFFGMNTGDMSTSIKQLRQFGYDGLTYYSQAIQQSMIDIAGDAVNHMVFAYPYVLYTDINDVTDPMMKEFCELYYEEYGKLPESEVCYRCWDFCIVMEEAVKKAMSFEPEAIQAAMLEISDLPILGGKANFAAFKDTAYGECLEEYNFFILIDGKSVSLKDWLETSDAANYIK